MYSASENSCAERIGRLQQLPLPFLSADCLRVSTFKKFPPALTSIQRSGEGGGGGGGARRRKWLLPSTYPPTCKAARHMES
ncbi:hypothetical protein Dimus_026265 [Dionaea muscipula]